MSIRPEVAGPGPAYVAFETAGLDRAALVPGTAVRVLGPMPMKGDFIGLDVTQPCRGTSALDLAALALGRLALGSLVLGRFALGRFALGRLALGRLALGRLVLGRLALGRLALGRLALDRLALGRLALGRLALGRLVLGRLVLGRLVLERGELRLWTTAVALGAIGLERVSIAALCMRGLEFDALCSLLLNSTWWIGAAEVVSVPVITSKPEGG